MEQAMNFHTLTRRELQALCKKNKIPANITNVAMIDSLKALEIIEGIEDILPKSESETAQSTVDSPVRSEVTSPCVPPTGGRTARRRNAVKVEPETAKPSIRAQRTTRKSRAIDADEPQAEAIETPAVAPQTRKKGQMASACRKMDSQFNECVEEEKKDVLVTPAPSGVTTRRRRGAKEESEVKRVYSTRRSVRLLEKNKELTNEVGNENSDFSKKELFTNNCQELEINTKESMDDLDEMSGITGAIDSDITLEENSEKKDEVEVVSVEKQETSFVKVAELVPPVDEVIMISDSEADLVNSELERGDAEIEEAKKYENKADLEEEEGCDGTGAPEDEIAAQEDNGSLDVQTSDIEIGFEIIEQDAEDAGCDGNYGENAVLEIGDVAEISSDIEVGFEIIEHDADIDAGEKAVIENGDVAEISSDVDTHSEIEKEISNDDDLDCGDVTVLYAEEGVLEINGSHDVKPSEVEKPEEQNTRKDAGFEDEVADGENLVLESEDNFAIGEDSSGTNIHNEIEKDVQFFSISDNGLDSEENKEVLETNAENESLSSEATEESLPFDISLMNEEDEASKWDAVFTYVNEAKDETNSVTESELQLQQPITEDTLISGKESDNAAGEMVYTIKSEEKATERVEPASASKASSAKKKRSVAVTDNKENIGSGGKIVLTKERVKIAKKKSSKNEFQVLDLGELSVRQLTKMLKEKLEITNNPATKNEDDMVPPPPARPALQALPENR